MDELFWGCDYENVNNQAEWLAMTTEVLELNVNKLFKIPKFMWEDEKMVQDIEFLMSKLGSSEDFDDSALWRCCWRQHKHQPDVVKHEPKKKYYDRLDNKK